MGAVSKVGKDAQLFSSDFGTEVTTGNLDAGKWFIIEKQGTSSAFPSGMKPGNIFRSPASGTPITLGTGDTCTPLTLKELCKTTMNTDFSEGTIDVTDDCSGSKKMVLDGYTDISVSIEGFQKYDTATGKLVDTSKEFIDRFLDVVTDNTTGTYTYAQKNNDPLIAFLALDRSVTSTQTLTFLILPLIIPSFSTSFGLTDAQGRSISANLSDRGIPTRYEHLRGSGDIKGS